MKVSPIQSFNQQHFCFSFEQSQEGSVFVRIPLIIAAAQPTPDLTVIAPNLQLRAQAPHSIQSSISMILALPLLISNTAWGQTIAHKPHPVQIPESSFKVTVFFKYCIVFISDQF